MIKLRFNVDGSDFVSCGKASEEVKRTLKNIGVEPGIIRRISIAMYEGEVNMVIHAEGGVAEVDIAPEKIIVTLTDTGKGIPDIDKAMQEGFSTATEAIRELGFGAGMGLPNMKANCDRIKLESEVGKGTKVTLEFDLT